MTKEQNNEILEEQNQESTAAATDDNIGAEYGDEDYNIEAADIDNSDTAVASTNASKILSLILLCVFIVVVLYVLYAPSDEDAAEEENKEVKIYSEQRAVEDAPVFNVAKEPELEIEAVVEDVMPNEQVVSQVVELDVPELPDLNIADVNVEDDFSLEPEFSNSEIFDAQDDEAIDVSLEGDMNNDANILGDEIDDIADTSEVNQGESYTPILIMNGPGITESVDLDIGESQTESVSATKISYPERTIVQGKLIDSVLETAINTDFEGKVRAIVSRDIYADFSNNILIPKGSRVIGSYTGSASTGQTRVLITWERLIRPDAVDILINSPTTDQFGRSGVNGNVDNKYLELFNNSILLSLITVGAAMAVEEATNSGGVTREEDSNGDTVTSATPSALAAEEIISTITSTAESVLNGVLNTTPTITVPHGTRIKIFVNQDLVFPLSTINNSNNSGVVFVK